MKISAQVRNDRDTHRVTLSTNGNAHSLEVLPKADGTGSSVNGGEFLFLALATCYCNDLYREAVKRGIRVTQVEVLVEGDFDREGASATNVSYRVKVAADAGQPEIRELLAHTDRIAEVHATLRAGIAVTLGGVEIVTG